MVPTTPLRATQFGTIVAATPAHEREEDQRLIGEILDNMNSHISANGVNPIATEQAELTSAEQGTAHWNVTVKALVQMAILDMLAKWETYTKDPDPEGKALNLSFNLVESVLRTLKKKFEADGRLLFSEPGETEGGVRSQGSGDDIPLYRWLLPRLCFAASEFVAKPTLKRFTSDTLDLAAYLVDAVGQYLDTQAPEGAMGMYLGKSLVSGLVASCTELLDTSKTNDQENFTIQTIAPDRKRRPATLQPQKEIGDGSPLYCMPFPKGNARIDLGLCIAQIIFRATCQCHQSVPNWTLSINDDFIAVSSVVCQTGRHLISKMDSLLQVQPRNEKREIAVLRQMEPITAILDLLSGSAKGALPPIPNPALQLIVGLCTRRITGRLSTTGMSVDTEYQQSLKVIDRNLLRTLEAIRTRRTGRSGGVFWNILADQWTHEIRDKCRDELDKVSPEIRCFWIKIVHCLVSPLAANPVSITQVVRPSDLEVVLRSLLREHDAEGNDSSLKHDMQMAFETIAPIQSAWLEQASNRGLKRKRNHQVSSQHVDRPDPTLLPTGIQLTIIGKEEHNAGLYSAISPFALQQQHCDKRPRVVLEKSAWHSDDVHRYCAIDPDFAEFVHDCWDPMAKILCECLPEDESGLIPNYAEHRREWYEEWSAKNHVMFEGMLSEGAQCLVRDVCARIESLGKSFPFSDKLKAVNLFTSLRKLYGHFPRIHRLFRRKETIEPWRCLEARHITVLCSFLTRTWTDPPERDPNVDIAFFSALQSALFSVKTDLSSKAFFSRIQCERLIECMETAFEKADRPVKVAVGACAVAFVQAWYQTGSEESATENIEPLVDFFAAQGDPINAFKAEPAISVMGEMAKYAQGRLLGELLGELLVKLGAPNSALRSLAYVQLLGVVRAHKKSAFNIVKPYMDTISIHIITSSLDAMNESLQFLGVQRPTFLRQNYVHILPYAILHRDADLIRHTYAAGDNDGSLGGLLINHNSDILAEVFTREHDSKLKDTLKFYRALVQGDNDTQVTIPKLITLCVAPLLVRMIVRLCKSESHDAILKALQRVHQFGHPDQRRQSTKQDVIIFLKQHMLGIISELNDMLHDMHEKKTIKQKLEVISSYEALIRLAGSTMAVYSPQILASLQSTIWVPQLRLETLEAWHAYATQLKFVDIGPYIGYTVAAFVSVWSQMTAQEKEIGRATIEYLIVDHVSLLHQYLDNVVDLSGISELNKAANRLKDLRSKQTLRERLQKLLERCGDDNVAVAERSLAELRSLLSEHKRELATFFRGDSFDCISTAIYRVLLLATGRDGETCQGIRDAAYDCMGVLGALDPDRFKLDISETPVLLSYNFGGYEESSDFAICLIQTSLISAYKTTTDTRHQAHLAYAIQELLKFCGFSPELFDDNIKSKGSHSLKVRERWRAFPQHMLDTIAPLLEGRYVYPKNLPVVHFPHPVYVNTSTYRQWLQRWAIDLLGNVLEAPEPKGSSTDLKVIAVKNSKIIFGAFHSVLKSSQDVGVAHHLLPHLILYLLFSKGPEIQNEIAEEIRAVLSDLVNHRNEVQRDRQNLSAQAVFDLLDHFSRWVQHQKTVIMRDFRGGRVDKINDAERRAEYQYLNEQIPKVEGLLNAIDAELQAEAALITQAYARSLRGFETRMAALRRSQRRTDADLQPYYEYLHRIYADLDEPDGMEGVSAFIVSPSMDHQIREHESVGRWTSAQSCWEVKLQDNADNLELHLGLLRCLRSLGHYDTLRTHIEGIISRHPEWAPDLANYRVEATWIVQDWESLSQIVESGADGPEISKARVLQAISKKDYDKIPELLKAARRQIGSTISANHRTYARNYPALLDLHMLHDLDVIQSTSADLITMQNISEANKDVHRRSQISELKETLSNRLSTISPSFKYQEPVLSMRRAGFNLVPNNLADLKNERGMAWLTTSKIARKAGHVQTAYSAILQAMSLHAPFAFVQQAKLLRANGQPLKALSELENMLPTLRTDSAVINLSGHPTPLHEEPFQSRQNVALAKALSLSARWAFETERLDANDIIKRFQKAIKLAQEQESPYYHLGHYYDQYAESNKTTENIDLLRLKVCENYALSLRFGVKYIYRTMPRMLTLWLDLGEVTAAEKKGKAASTATNVVEKMNKVMDNARRELPKYQWLIAFGQIVARIAHPNKNVYTVLLKIMRDVLKEYTRQAVWSFVGSYHSRDSASSKAKTCQHLFLQIKGANTTGNMAQRVIDSAVAFSSMLLRLSEDPGIDKDYDPTKSRKEKPNHNKLHLTISANFPYAARVFPSEMIMPLQNALTCTLPSSSETLKTHNPFMQGYVIIQGMHDDIEVMPSLQRPKKLCFIGNNGRKYNFLAKPEDDLRKDARLMEFNSMINKLLKGNTDTRKRNLYIRTYAVMPLNEECGLLEWVNNTIALRAILTKLYEREKKKVFSNQIYSDLDAARLQGPAEAAKCFKTKILPQFAPYVFHQWFFEMWPEPNAWFTARTAYARTLAVMSIVGFVLGLGDRHGENILFDSTTGDTVHVDFNCLFEKGKTFAVPERVPFRLTANMVDALGATGYEGIFRRAAEVTFEELRTNRDSLTSVLEAFIHDPLTEWQAAKDRAGRKSKSSHVDFRQIAAKALDPIRWKLKGTMGDSGNGEMSVTNQVDTLIKEATSPANLGQMYVGWASWL